MKKFLKIIQRFIFYKQWILLYDLQPESTSPNLSLKQFTQLIPPKKYNWADPFAIYHNNSYYIFYEEFEVTIFRKGDMHGEIGCIKIDQQGNIIKNKIVLSKPYHLSYPFVFHYQNSFFMLPETAQNGTIELYRATNFPWQWELEKVIMHNVYATDSTLLKHNGKWWLFSSMRENDEPTSNEQLFLYSADDLFSDSWTPHPANPVISDHKSARPAGKIYRNGQDLIRPSQNCVPQYGYSIKLNKINTLTDQDYKETLLHELTPGWNMRIILTHTLNFSHGLTVSDAERARPKYLFS